MCASITAALPNGLVGAHVTVDTEPELLEQMLQMMRTGGGGNAKNIYVIGAFTHFKANSGVHMNTRKKLKNRIKESLNKNAIIRFYDASAHGEIHIFAEKNFVNTNFYWIKRRSHEVFGFVYPTFYNRTRIRENHFCLR
ncbi:hypothetical protein NX722_20650 [Endozoicomonas gorgoniicola]|uniref:Uncharacterized protein n=1 Tax=Endozoicomonas gorgoniicola TaxID=1234144 RepID=A0ABT3N036_9GAMM|nr:hypothetical protein [Endozoicomonas gorgoniicola]MCW7554986.1 hypothetical protein [Endozoicomonas gorgoniicola]